MLSTKALLLAFGGASMILTTATAAGPTIEIASIVNPVAVLPKGVSKPTESSGYKKHATSWPNFKAVKNGDSFMGRCGIPFTHKSHGVCVSQYHGAPEDICGRRISMSLRKDGVPQTSATVVDICSVFAWAEIGVTADIYKDLGGSADVESVGPVKLVPRIVAGGHLALIRLAHSWWIDETEPPNNLKTFSSDLPVEATLVFGEILWAAGLLLLLTV